jgi:hypothetical protein
VIYKGLSYANRDSAYDEIVDLPEGITASSSANIVYDKLTGFPLQSSNITLINSMNRVSSLSINTKGSIDY